MASATNRTERLAKALKETRPDFTLHNARVFARAVIDAPSDVFGGRPLTFLPREQGAVSAELLRGTWPQGIADDEAENLGGAGPHAVLSGRGGAAKSFGAVVPIDSAHPDFFRLDSAATAESAPISPADARPGDLVVQPGGASGIYLGNGLVFVDGHAASGLTDLKAHAAAVASGGEKLAPPSALPAECAWNRLAHEAVRPWLPDHGFREHAVTGWRSTEFVLGVDANGADVTWKPALAPGIAVIGRTGSGKSVLAGSLIEQARARGWMTLHATSVSGGSPDPLKTPGLVASTTPHPARNGDGGLGFNTVIEMARRILRTRVLQQRASLDGFLDPIDRDAPTLVVLDGIDIHLARYRDVRATTADQDWLTTVLTEILTRGRESRVHIVMTSQTSTRLPKEWFNLFSSIVLAGEPDRATGRELTGFERFPAGEWNPRGRMLLITDSFSYTPFQAYIAHSGLDVVEGQYPRMALDTSSIELGADTSKYTDLMGLPAALLDRNVNGLWEPDPDRVDLDPWEPFRS